MIKVLIVEDSVVVQEFLEHILSSDPSIQVVGIANNGEEAIELVRQEKPDVITMDIHMPKMDGFETTKLIMETMPTPIVIISVISRIKESSYTFRLLEAGALAVVLRPPAFDNPMHKTAVDELIQTVKLMSEVKVVRRIRSAVSIGRKADVTKMPEVGETIQLIAIGASTGGPQVLQKILSRLPRDLSVPVLIVQHIAAGFVEGFVDWLGGSILLPLHIPVQGEKAMPGHCYIAPDNCHMGVGRDMRIVLDNNKPKNGQQPSVAFLFHSVAEVLGPHAVGVLLTGMGRDGAIELKEMKDKGAVTLVQNEESSIIFGMPGEAIKLDAATYILSPEEIADSLAALVKKNNGRFL
ncbi:MAG: chemotaxis-specific protein-glutamate methyltransferase CheB [Elusimicrobiota bacterium]